MVDQNETQWGGLGLCALVLHRLCDIGHVAACLPCLFSSYWKRRASYCLVHRASGGIVIITADPN